MSDKRITVKDLKKWLKDIPDDCEVFVETYENQHAKEFLRVVDYDENGKPLEKEIIVASIDTTKLDI